mmetsp:Transcript_2823/g.4215  ORF Transcript_2823/g.4215 Transcript_2823/m.4215 type:complete len:97 (-) Transcript_2823:731-1021(-)
MIISDTSSIVIARNIFNLERCCCCYSLIIDSFLIQLADHTQKLEGLFHSKQSLDALFLSLLQRPCLLILLSIDEQPVSLPNKQNDATTSKELDPLL